MKTFLTPAEEEQILAAIKAAEEKTSGEVRVHIESQCTGNPVDRAVELFFSLEMQATQQRNGVLIYVATQDHKLAIIGDSGINDVVPDDFWDKARDLMTLNFKNGRFADGITGAVKLAGEQLVTYFPYNRDDSDELSNEISFGE